VRAGAEPHAKKRGGVPTNDRQSKIQKASKHPPGPTRGRRGKKKSKFPKGNIRKGKRNSRGKILPTRMQLSLQINCKRSGHEKRLGMGMPGGKV